jgi:biopolymer transport protein ExbD
MKLKRKHKVTAEIPLSSIADLAMLLLVFFVICGKVTSRSPVSVEPPVSLTGEDATENKPLVVTVTADGETFLDGRMVEAKELLDELEAIMQSREGRAGRTVLIEVDRRTAYKDYIVAVDAVNRVKGYVELKVRK